MGGGRRTPYPPAFDGYRGLIILAIVMLHITGFVDWVPQNDVLHRLRSSTFFTIEFLFVVSGFVLFLPVAARGALGSVRIYALRRAARIVPAYLVSLIATAIVVAAIGHPPLPMGALEAFATHLVFAQHEFDVSGLGVNAVYWILSIIVLFYVLLPLVAKPYLRHPLLGLAIAVAIVAAWRSAFPDELTYVQFIQFPLFVADFAIGMTAAWLFMRVWRAPARERVARAAVPVALVAGTVLVVLLYAVGAQRVDREIFFFGESTLLAIAIPTAFVVVMSATAFLPSWAQWPFTNRAVRWTGDISYGVFLYHVLVIRLAMEAFGYTHDHATGTVLKLTAIVLPISIILGWLSFRFVEQPLRRWARSLEPDARVSTPGVEAIAREPATSSV